MFSRALSENILHMGATETSESRGRVHRCCWLRSFSNEVKAGCRRPHALLQSAMWGGRCLVSSEYVTCVEREGDMLNPQRVAMAHNTPCMHAGGGGRGDAGPDACRGAHPHRGPGRRPRGSYPLRVHEQPARRRQRRSARALPWTSWKRSKGAVFTLPLCLDTLCAIAGKMHMHVCRCSGVCMYVLVQA